MMRRYLITIEGAIIALLILPIFSARVLAENYAFQFVCIDNRNETKTPWMDERLTNAVSFSKGREGQRYFWAADDCGDYGPMACPWHPGIPSEWAWVEHRSRHSCDEVCINLRDIDTQLYRYPAEEEKRLAPNSVTIRRYTWDQDDRNSDLRFTATNNTWNLSQAEITAHASPTHTGNEGVTYCWDEWTDNFWVALHNEGASGRVTEVEFVDHQDIRHIFRAVPAYPTPSGWD